MKKWVVVITCLVILLVSLAGCSKSKSSDSPVSQLINKVTGEETGFHQGNNVINAGVAAGQGDWIYYCLKGKDGKLTRVRTDGSERSVISDDKAENINVVGDWIYYRVMTNIYKVGLDGSKKTNLNTMGFNLIVVGDWMYYTGDGGFYKARLDGTQQTLIGKANALSFNVYDDWIYYSDQGDTYRLHRIKTDGSKQEALTGVGATYPKFAGKNLYYYCVEDRHIYKAGLDGTSPVKLTDDRVGSFNLSGDWIYYFNVEDSKVYKMKLDGTERSVFLVESAHSFSMAGDWIFYDNANDGWKLYKIRTDGTGRALVQ